MAEGTIKRLTDKGFGFISTPGGTDMFFHMSNLDGVRFEELREGQKVGDWNKSATVAAQAAKLDPAQLLTRAQAADIRQRAQSTTQEFHSLRISQRPAFLLESTIGDRAVFSGLVRIKPLVATIDAMLGDAAAYASHAAHFGPPPNA